MPGRAVLRGHGAFPRRSAHRGALKCTHVAPAASEPPLEHSACDSGATRAPKPACRTVPGACLRHSTVDAVNAY
jgi:hypothetical protein